jgi:hypothetical protein
MLFCEPSLPRFPTLGDQTWSKFFQSAVPVIPPRSTTYLLRLMIDQPCSYPMRLSSRQDLIYLLELMRFQHPLLSPDMVLERIAQGKLHHPRIRECRTEIAEAGGGI